jgi:hypothetical protein
LYIWPKQYQNPLVKKASPFIYIIVVFLVAFLPIASLVFALKNDFFLGYFPPKFLLSETISSGQFPLWNPYISFGLPFYADMNGAYWNPLTWIIALTTGYSAYTLTFELLLYVLLGGIGMYKLATHFSKNKYLCAIAGVAFMCNGFVIGHLQHLNWISCSAFLPWCIWGILHINKFATIKNVLTSVVSFYLLISSSHPGMIIGSIYFFFALIIFLLYNRYKDRDVKGLKNSLKGYVIFLLLLALLSSGLAASYIDILPHFARNEKVDLSLSLSENTTAQSWISLLLPFATVKNKEFFENDIALRNNYIGLTLLCFLLLSFFINRIRIQWFFLMTGFFFLVLSLGGQIKLFAHTFLPLIGYVRVNGEFRIFSITCFILASTCSFDYFLAHKEKIQKKLMLVTSFLILVCVWCMVFAFVRMLQGQSLFSNNISISTTNWRDLLKNFITGLQFSDTVLLQSLIQIPLIYLILKAIQNLNFKRLTLLTAIDLILATSFNMAFTGVGKVPVSQIAAIHQQSPKGIPTPKLQVLKLHDTIPNNDSALVGDWSFYNKQIGKSKPVLYPVKITNNYLFYQSLKKDSSITVANDPFMFLASSISTAKITNIQSLQQEDLKSFSTNKIHIQFTAKDSGYLILLQNYYPHWRYTSNTSNNLVKKAGISFIAVPVRKGENSISIYFNPKLIKILFVFSTGLFLIFIIFIFLPVSKRILFP